MKKPKAKKPIKPDPLKGWSAKRCWTAWKFARSVKEDRETKVPYVALKKRAEVNNSSMWLSRKEARALAKAGRFDGIGILLGSKAGGRHLVGLDIDTCRDKGTGDIAPWALEAVQRFGSYTEISPTQTGLKVFFSLSEQSLRRARALLGSASGRQWKSKGGAAHPPGFEFYTAKRFFTVTGKRLRGTSNSIKEASTSAIEWLFETAGPAAKSLGSETQSYSIPWKSPSLGEEVRSMLNRLESLAGSDAHLQALLRGDAGRYADQTASNRDFALGGYCKDAGFSREQTDAVLIAFPHGRGAERHAKQDVRYFERIWNRVREHAQSVEDARPVIKIRAGQLPDAVDQAEAALLASGAPLFQRGETIVQPTQTLLQVAGGRTIQAFRLRQAKPAAITEAMSRAARFQTFDARKRKWKNADCKKTIAEAYLTRGSWNLRPLVGIINAPTLRSDGSLVKEPGYDAAMRLLFEPSGASFSRVAKKPTHADAKRAYELLREPFSEFPFVSAADEAVAIAGVLTGVARPSLETAPLFAFTAPAAGTGKSLAVNVISSIVTGATLPVMSQGGSKDEFEKRLAAALMAGDPMISIDNCQAPLGGDLLCQALTEPVVNPRVLGFSINVKLPMCSTIFATGNNLRILGDLTRRVLLCSLDAKTEYPERRKFEGNPLTYVAEHRGRLVAAALTIMRAYRVAGRPLQKKKKPIGSYGQWCRVVREAIIWAGGADPCVAFDRARATDPEREALSTLTAAWLKHVGSSQITVKELLKKAEADSDGGLKDALLLAVGERGSIENRKLGAYLAKIKDRVIGGRSIVRRNGRSNTAAWQLVKAE